MKSPAHETHPGEDAGDAKRIKLSASLTAKLTDELRSTFAILFKHIYPNPSLFGPEDLFGEVELQAIVDRFGLIGSVAILRKTIGGQTITGQLEALQKIIDRFAKEVMATETQQEMELRYEEERVAEAKRVEEEEKRARELEAERITKEIEDNRKRAEQEHKRGEEAWKAEQALHMSMLVKLAGEEAERRGVESIHRGR
ncbi:hypothetical protein PtB15_1B431 [Puccinia triticina]|nr:hypothetical protein PtB15_1B431 [Puccinia triticina]